MQAAHIDRVLDLNPEKVKQCMDAGLLQYRKRANEIVAHLMAKDDERTAVYREYEQGSISLEQVEEYEHQYQVAVQKQEAAFKKVMLAVNDIEKAFSHGNPWLMKFRAISIPEKLERTHLKEWLDHVWIVDFEQVEVILQESEWKRFFPEEWLNNGEPVKKDTDNLQAVMNTVGEAGDVMHLSQNVVETFIDRIEVFNDKRVKIHFTFEDVLKSYETG